MALLSASFYCLIANITSSSLSSDGQLDGVGDTRSWGLKADSDVEPPS
jgi:hypothetical protein